MNPKNDEARRLVIRRETLRELSPIELGFVRGAISDANSDVSNCCCQPTSNQGGDTCAAKY